MKSMIFGLVLTLLASPVVKAEQLNKNSWGRVAYINQFTDKEFIAGAILGETDVIDSKFNNLALVQLECIPKFGVSLNITSRDFELTSEQGLEGKIRVDKKRAIDSLIVADGVLQHVWSPYIEQLKHGSRAMVQVKSHLYGFNIVSFSLDGFGEAYDEVYQICDNNK